MISSHSMIGISPINHGTTLDGIVLLGKMLHLFDVVQPIFDSFAPAFYELGKFSFLQLTWELIDPYSEF